ncbi:MAG: protein kinase, partial [Akkermansiaceae bacterium]|nr:protein kinase [Akkermansiaceae bacterium]
MQVLHQVAERLRDLHAAGWVHRDVKPGNVMFLHHKRQWTLIDFGCAGKSGTTARNMFTVMYAAPEVLQASCRGEQRIRVTEAMDAWSLGVMALEMFAGNRPFGGWGSKAKVPPSAACPVLPQFCLQHQRAVDICPLNVELIM